MYSQHSRNKGGFEVHLMSSGKKIYVLENQDGNIKIGVSKNVDSRVKAIKNQTGYTILNVFSTVECFNPFELEKMIHEELKDKKIFGEWFNVKFDIGKSVAIRVFNENAKLHDDRKKSDFDFAKYFHPELF